MALKPIPQRAVFGIAVALVALCVVARLLPHPPNFAPAAAVALFGCVFLSRRWHAAAIVMVGMGIGDYFLGFYDLGVMLTVYASMLLPLAARRLLGESANAVRIGGVAIASGIGFYLTTNAAVWAFTGAYPPTAEGLAASYVAGLPFLKWTLAGNLFFAAVLFGIYRAVASGARRRGLTEAYG